MYTIKQTETFISGARLVHGENSYCSCTGYFFNFYALCNKLHNKTNNFNYHFMLDSRLKLIIKFYFFVY